MQMIRNGENEVFVSVASIWETAIKAPLKRKSAPGLSAAEFREACLGTDFQLLAIESAHAEEVERLPLLHHDPFDRIIIAQARVERLRLVTKDRVLASYGGDVLTWR